MRQQPCKTRNHQQKTSTNHLVLRKDILIYIRHSFTGSCQNWVKLFHLYISYKHEMLNDLQSRLKYWILTYIKEALITCFIISEFWIITCIMYRETLVPCFLTNRFCSFRSSCCMYPGFLKLCFLLVIVVAFYMNISFTRYTR